MSNLDPDMRVERIQDIDLPLLWSQGIRGLIFDLDNTITPWHQYAANDEIIRWFEQVRQYGFQACILSNSGEAKTAQISEWLDVPVLSDSRKPRAYGFRRAGRLLQLPPQLLKKLQSGGRSFSCVFLPSRRTLCLPTSRQEPVRNILTSLSSALLSSYLSYLLLYSVIHFASIAFAL